MSSAPQPSRALLIAAGILTQLIGIACLILALASVPIVIDTHIGLSGVIASIVASLGALVCGSLVWRGRLVPLALAAGLDVGFGIGLPRGGSAIGSMLRILPATDAKMAESLILVAATMMFVAAILCVLAVPSALKLREWARGELARGDYATAYPPPGIDEAAPTKERPRLSRPSGRELAPPRPAPFRAGNTLQGMVPIKILPTQVLNIGTPSRKKPAVVIGIAVTMIALGIIVISAATGSKVAISAENIESKREVTSVISGSAGSPTVSTGGTVPEVGPATGAPNGAMTDATSGAGAGDTAPIEAFVARFHAALGGSSENDLVVLFASKAFAFGADANDLAEGRDGVVAQLREDIGDGGPVSVKFSHLGHDGDVAWIAEDLRVGDRPFLVTAVLGLHAGIWTIEALHWAVGMANATAYKLAREGNLTMPDAIPNANDSSPLAIAMRTAFASKPSFVDARSTRADAFNFGSAPGERIKGGDAIKKLFGRIAATIHLHDAVKVGMIGDRGGWGVANVAFTDADRDGAEVTQTFRVLAAWIKEDAGWRIVLTQFSNPR